VAPPDHHVLLRSGHVHLARGPRENGHRPAVDALFRSAAREYGSRVIGVVLSGALDDGTAGLAAIKARGGLAVVQEPADALYPNMPESALRLVRVDVIQPAAAMGALLARLAAEPAGGATPAAPAEMEVEVDVSGFSCPDCNGVLWEIRDGALERFRCRVGHAWSPEGLMTQQSEGLEAALWIAMRSLEERAPWPGSWPSRPGAAGTRSRPPGSRSRRPRPGRRPGRSATCCSTGPTSPPRGRWPSAAAGRAGRRRRVADQEADRDLEVVLDYLRRSRGFDFTGYKRASLSRRIEKRMRAVGADGYLSYLDHLEVDPEEFTHLFNTILINVTSFFRDPPIWDYLGAEILPRLAADKPAASPSGCGAPAASGEEAYSLAMATAEALGADTVRDRVKIYATDVDEEALNQARQARYGPRQVEGVSPQLLERYFEPNGNGHVFSKDLRRSVIFGRHDLIQDAPSP
jgi:chemotaxis methyl-accepting protein methylase